MRNGLFILLLLAAMPLFADYSVSIDSNLPYMQFGPSNEYYSGDYFTINNTGDEDTFTLTTTVSCDSTSPMVMFCDNQGMCYPGSHSFSLGNGESIEFRADIIPNNYVGQIDYAFVLTSEHMTEPMQLDFRFISGEVQGLLVNDSGDNTLVSYYKSAAQSCGISYGVWDNTRTPLTADAVTAFSNFIWFTGTAYPPIDANDRSMITNIKNGNKNLILSGQRIASSLSAGTTEEQDFLHNVLGGNSVSEDSGDNTIVGTEENPWAGKQYTLNGGDGANNQVYRGVMSAYANEAGSLLDYSVGGSAGIGISNNQYHLLTLGFGMEGINSRVSRADFLRTILANIGLPVGTNDNPAAPQSKKSIVTNYPNPFNPSTTICWSLKHNQLPVNLTIYNVKGQAVRSLTGLTGSQYLWNGTDDHNQLVASGVYFIKIGNAVETSTRKMMLMK